MSKCCSCLYKRLQAKTDRSDIYSLQSLKEVSKNTSPSGHCLEARPLATIVQSQPKSLHTTDQCHNDNDPRDLSLPLNTHPKRSVIPLTNLPPIEAALSIEMISKTIFSLLEPSDLLRCRLVSKSWVGMATNEKLLKWNTNKIIIDHFMGGKEPSNTTVHVKSRRRRLKYFTNLLDGIDSYPFLFPVGLCLNLTLAPNTDNFFIFLDRYGFVIRWLKITFRSKDMEGAHFVYEVNSLLAFMTKLLTEQLPNLEELLVRFDTEEIKFAGEIDPQVLLSIKSGSYLAGKQNQKLRAVKAYDHTPYEIVDALCCLAPKSKDFWVSDGRFWGQKPHRAYLLKMWSFIPILRYWDEVDTLEAIIASKEKLNLEELTVDFSYVGDKRELWARLAPLLTQTLEMNCHSLKKLTLSQVYFLPGAVLPQMPQVKRLGIEFAKNAIPEFSVLPQGTSITTIFPSLDTITFLRDTSVANATNFLKLCKNEEVALVRKIQVYSCGDGDIFRRRFPNAVMVYCSPFWYNQ